MALMKHAEKKAGTLIEALPYIQEFYGKTIVVKYGGNAMTLAEFTAENMPENSVSKSGVCKGPKYFSYKGVTLYKLKNSFLKNKE